MRLAPYFIGNLGGGGGILLRKKNEVLFTYFDTYRKKLALIKCL